MSDRPWRDVGWDDDLMRDVWDALRPVYHEAAKTCTSIAKAMGNDEAAKVFGAMADMFGKLLAL